MFQIDLKSRKAIYAQIIDNFKRLIITGVLKPDEKVPSIREMSQQLTVNPNTVQKAYRELESQGYFYTVLGQGSFIVAQSITQQRPIVLTLYEELRNHVQTLIYYNESKENIIQFIENMDNKLFNENKEEGAKGNGTHPEFNEDLRRLYRTQ